MSKGYKRMTKKCKMLEQELMAKCNESKALVEELETLKKSKECKGLEQELKALRKSFDELEASRECLKEDHEDLEIAHTRLKEAHSTLLELVKEKDIMLEKLKKKAIEEKVIMTCDIGLTYDLIDDSIIVESTNSSCSTSTTISTISDDFTCDASLIVENEILKKEVNELNRALGKAYGGEARLLKSLGSQRFSLNKEGLGYTPKKGNAAFTTHKHSFMKSDDRFCNRCKQVGHLEHNCNKINKNKKNVNLPYIHFDSCYVLTKGEKGVHAKFVGTPIVGPKKKVIWVPKSLVTNLQGPKQVWVHKRH
jgi:DNA repair exonuclease SbcCD ATPase subunit